MYKKIQQKCGGAEEYLLYLAKHVAVFFTANLPAGRGAETRRKRLLSLVRGDRSQGGWFKFGSWRHEPRRSALKLYV